MSTSLKHTQGASGSRRKLVANSLYLVIINLLNKVSNVIIFIILARTTSNVQAGIFTISTTYLLIFSALTGGLDDLLIRQIARDRSQSGEYFISYLSLRLPLMLVLYLIMTWLVTQVFDYSSNTRSAILLIGLCLFPDNLSYVGQALLAGHEQFTPSLLSMIVNSCIKIIGGILSVRYQLGVAGIAIVWLIGSMSGAIIVLVSAFILTRNYRVRISFDRTFWIDQSRMIIPFLIIGLMVTIEYQVDVVILSLMRDPGEVALLSAMTTIIFAFTLISQAIRVAVFPTMERVRNSSPLDLPRLYSSIIHVMLILSFPIAAGLFLVADQTVQLVFGSGLLGSVLPLRITAFTIILFFLNVPNVRILLVYNRERYIMMVLSVSVLINILVNLLFDKTYGVIGASIARVCSSLFFFIFIYMASRKIVINRELLSMILRTSFALLVMIAVLLLIRDQPLFIQVTFGAFVYFLTLVLIKGFPQRESINLFLSR